jgi:hypothetical protein
MENAEFRVLSAMLKAGLKRKPKLSPVQHAKCMAREAERQQRRYCDAFGLWQTCRLKTCRRQRRCEGDANACLRRALDRVPRHTQVQARAAILKATPPNIGAPEREARQRMPRDFYECDASTAAVGAALVAARRRGDGLAIQGAHEGCPYGHRDENQSNPKNLQNSSTSARGERKELAACA